MNQLDKERQMFGETVNQMEDAKPSYSSNRLYAMSILSDVQEVLAQLDESIGEPANQASQAVKQHLETSRQWINKAKFFLMHEE